MGKHMGGIILRRLQSENILIFNLYYDTKSPLPINLGSLRFIAWAVDNGCPETLFTLIYTPAALIVIFTPSIYVEEESPFELPLLAFAHKSRSFFLSLWGVSLS